MWYGEDFRHNKIKQKHVYDWKAQVFVCNKFFNEIFTLDFQFFYYFYRLKKIFKIKSEANFSKSMKAKNQETYAWK